MIHLTARRISHTSQPVPMADRANESRRAGAVLTRLAPSIWAPVGSLSAVGHRETEVASVQRGLELAEVTAYV